MRWRNAMAMRPASAETIAVAVLAKAPVPGLAKTRLIPVLGADGAAALQARLIERTIATACASDIGPVTLWATPDQSHPLFASLAARFPVALACQPDGDLGERMLAAVVAANLATLVIGTDCPALTVDGLRAAADLLRGRGVDVVTVPAEDGGYVLIGMRKPQRPLLTDMTWGVASVMAETRRRVASLGLSSRELAPLWDVDTPTDLERLRGGLVDLIG